MFCHPTYVCLCFKWGMHEVDASMQLSARTRIRVHIRISESVCLEPRVLRIWRTVGCVPYCTAPTRTTQADESLRIHRRASSTRRTCCESSSRTRRTSCLARRRYSACCCAKHASTRTSMGTCGCRTRQRPSSTQQARSRARRAGAAAEDGCPAPRRLCVCEAIFRTRILTRGKTGPLRSRSGCYTHDI